MDILVTFHAGQDNLERLRQQYPQCQFHAPGRGELPEELVRRAEIIVGGIDRDMMTKAESLRWFHSVSAGVDPYIDDADTIFGLRLLLSNSAGNYGVPISEHLLAMALALLHRLDASVRNMPEGKWGGVPHCRELTGATVGIVGLGDIGRHLAVLLEPFGCHVLAFKRTPAKPSRGVAEMLYGDDGLDELLRRSDVVCVCLPGTPDTRGMIDGRRLALMKQTALILNIGRGYIVDTEALADALAAGCLAGAGLDVTDPEPLPPEHRLWRLPNVIITPHISGYTPPHWQRRATEFFAKNLDAYLAGKPLPGAVDRVNRY